MKHPTAPATIEIAEIDDRRALREVDVDDEEFEGQEALPCPNPKCGFLQPVEFAARPRAYGPPPLDVCLSCGQLMTFDMQIEDAEERLAERREPPGHRHTPTPVPTDNEDFKRLTPKTCRQLLANQSLTHRLAQMRGYSLLARSMKGGRA